MSGDGKFVKCFVGNLMRFPSVLNGKDAGEQKRGPAILLPWNDLHISKVEVRGVVLGCSRIASSGFQFTLDDSTGRIACMVWSDEAGLTPESLSNKYVSVTGSLTRFRADLQIKVDIVTILPPTEEPTEECLWWLEVKQQWERLACLSRKSTVSQDNDVCPCLCHATCGTACRTIGDSSVWPHSFNRAVFVASSTLRKFAASSTNPQLSLPEIISMFKSRASESASMSIVECFSECAVMEAVRLLVREEFLVPSSDMKYFKLYSKSQTIAPPPAEPDEVSRYPATPAWESQLSQPAPIPHREIEGDRMKPRFFGTSHS